MLAKRKGRGRLGKVRYSRGSRRAFGKKQKKLCAEYKGSEGVPAKIPPLWPALTITCNNLVHLEI